MQGVDRPAIFAKGSAWVIASGTHFIGGRAAMVTWAVLGQETLWPHLLAAVGEVVHEEGQPQDLMLSAGRPLIDISM